MKNYRFLGEEAEVLGLRLDAARHALNNSTTLWSINYWSQTVERLLFQWRQLPILHDAEAQTTIVPRWNVGYDFYERGHVNEGDGVTDRIYHKLFKHENNLEASWHAHRAQRLARAQF